MVGLCMATLSCKKTSNVIHGAGVTPHPFVNIDRQALAKEHLKEFEKALEFYEARNRGLPTQDQGLKALAERPTLSPQPPDWRAYLEAIPQDPWGREYKYRIPAQKSDKSYDVYSVGEDGVEGNEDDIGNWKAGTTK